MALVMVSCDKCKDANQDQRDYSQGDFIVNEGSFGNSNGSITYVGGSLVVADVFQEVNSLPVGDVVTDFDRIGDFGYTVSNNTQKVIVTKAVSFERTAEISGFNYPREFVQVSSNVAAVSDGATNGSVKFIDLISNTVFTSVNVGKGPEGMLMQDGKLYVCNSGGWDVDSTVSVVNVGTFQVAQTYNVARKPVEIARASDGYLWVLCSGETQYDVNWNIIGHTPAALVRINPADGSTLPFQIGSLGDHPLHMALDALHNRILIANNQIEIFDLASLSFSATPFADIQANGIDINPLDNYVWVCGPTDFTTNSVVTVFDTNGNIARTVNAGIGARKIAFK
jgi:hypothetical protein